MMKKELKTAFQLLKYTYRFNGDIAKEYGYAYGSDATLKGIIDNYVKERIGDKTC